MDPHTLERRIEEIRVRLSSFSADQQSQQNQLGEVQQSARSENRRGTLLAAKLYSRNLANKVQVDRWVLVLLLSPAIAGFSFVLIDIVTGARLLSVFVGVTLGAAAAAVLTALLKSGEDSQLEPQIHESRQKSADLQQQVVKLTDQIRSESAAISTCNSELAAATQELAAVQYRNSKERILQNLYLRNWKSYRDVEFEQFLEEVLNVQGYTVETTAITGDQGVDLVVAKGGDRVAIQVKRYYSSVSNAAIQQAYAGMAHYKCQACAVITNSRFTSSAFELAKSTNCLLIDEDSFRDFVLGRLDLFARMAQ